MQKLYRFLDNKITLPKLEKLICESSNLEKEIGEENYQYLLEFN